MIFRQLFDAERSIDSDLLRDCAKRTAVIGHPLRARGARDLALP
ncbi:MAG TPA: hypothetical protein VMH26_04160 [Burkholderiales bacterium]|nr:hypothetical protein [Burkholderiales bacterium]